MEKEALTQREMRRTSKRRKPDTPRKPMGAGMRLSEVDPWKVIGGLEGDRRLFRCNRNSVPP